jgi:hypothetical protein
VIGHVCLVISESLVTSLSKLSFIIPKIKVMSNGHHGNVKVCYGMSLSLVKLKCAFVLLSHMDKSFSSSAAKFVAKVPRLSQQKVVIFIDFTMQS